MMWDVFRAAMAAAAGALATVVAWLLWSAGEWLLIEASAPGIIQGLWVLVGLLFGPLAVLTSVAVVWEETA